MLIMPLVFFLGVSTVVAFVILFAFTFGGLLGFLRLGPMMFRNIHEELCELSRMMGWSVPERMIDGYGDGRHSLTYRHRSSKWERFDIEFLHLPPLEHTLDHHGPRGPNDAPITPEKEQILKEILVSSISKRMFPRSISNHTRDDGSIHPLVKLRLGKFTITDLKWLIDMLDRLLPELTVTESL